nr:MAG TPA: hypothetical protein [Caudoviricetes sp.]
MPSNGEKKDKCRDATTGRFTKGNKTGGRKRIPDDIKKMLREASPDAVKLLIDTMNNKKEATDLRIKCAEKILERVYGKTVQPIDADLNANSEFIVNIKVID